MRLSRKMRLSECRVKLAWTMPSGSILHKVNTNQVYLNLLRRSILREANFYFSSQFVLLFPRKDVSLQHILLWVRDSLRWWWIVSDKRKPHIAVRLYEKWVVTYTACPLRKLTWIVNHIDWPCKGKLFSWNNQIFFHFFWNKFKNCISWCKKTGFHHFWLTAKFNNL